MPTMLVCLTLTPAPDNSICYRYGFGYSYRQSYSARWSYSHIFSSLISLVSATAKW